MEEKLGESLEGASVSAVEAGAVGTLDAEARFPFKAGGVHLNSFDGRRERDSLH